MLCTFIPHGKTVKSDVATRKVTPRRIAFLITFNLPIPPVTAPILARFLLPFQKCIGLWGSHAANMRNRLGSLFPVNTSDFLVQRYKNTEILFHSSIYVVYYYQQGHLFLGFRNFFFKGDWAIPKIKSVTSQNLEAKNPFA